MVFCKGRKTTINSPRVGKKMKEIEFNINYDVKIKLTQTGLDILRAIHDDLDSRTSMKTMYYPPTVDMDGFTTMQLSSVMHDFGPGVFMGARELPFATEIKLVC